MEVKAKISEAETLIKEASEAIKKLVAKGVPLSSEDRDTLAYLRQKESNLRQEKTALLQKLNNLRQKEARLEALAASTGSKASAGPGKTSARGASRYGQRVQLISRVHAREKCGLMFQPLPHPPYLFAFYI